MERGIGVVVRVELRGKRWNLQVVEYLQDGSCLPDLCEEGVTETATDITKVLNRMGCRVNIDDV